MLRFTRLLRIGLVSALFVAPGCASGGGSPPTPDAGPAPMDAGPGDAGPPAVDCENATFDGDETGIDCGGSCPGCPAGEMCGVADDCESGVCDRGRCLEPSCVDGVRNGDETGTDCGADCGLCPGGERCSSNDECISGRCRGSVCAESACDDGTMNGEETDVDCGGSMCPGCAGGSDCDVAGDCDSLICTAGTCAAAACDDSVMNQDETSVDCGGAVCPACPDGMACSVDSDCEGMRCYDGGCVSCTDMLMDAEETDVDCGGGLCPPCGGGLMCSVDTDCASGSCVAGACTSPPEFVATFPTATSTVCSFGTCGALGAGGAGRYYRTGDYVEETITGTGLASITSLVVSFEMDDYTSGCAVGQPLTWVVKVNGTTVGSYGYTGGARLGRHRITGSYTFAAISGTGAGSASYTLRYEATATVCSGGSSWNWFPGGSATLRN